MSLKEIFVKPINRPIEGVIKADDDQSLRLELDEYVVTNEIEGRLDVFLDAYNNYENANGVWISGFLVLENHTYSRCYLLFLQTG